MPILLPVHKIKPPLWMRDPDLLYVLNVLNKGDLNARMVGGCIRNYYMSKNIYDIDIACKLLPEKSQEILENASIRVIATGVEHGTITAHINGKNFEVTTLRKDVNTDGRHAKVEFSESWEEDARRRDFTINALYADSDGSIYDPLGTGLKDLEDRKVRFIGNAKNRIQEDYLRILRFFRFYAEYHEGDPDPEALDACKDLKNNICALSDERIYDELHKMLKLSTAHRGIEAMVRIQLFDLQKQDAEHLKSLITLQNQLNLDDVPTRIFILNKLNKYIKNNKINNFFKLLNEFIDAWDGHVKKALYHFDRDVVVQGLLVIKSRGGIVDDMIISDAMNMRPPEFPIVASDIMEQFKISEGPEVGEKMKAAEQIWIDSGFTLHRQDILEKL